ncbi:hypothetical protein BH10PAT1_BH10PAT1_6490 [soil metagenome]
MLFKNAIEASLKINLPLVIISTVCPSYTTDINGTPTYEGLEIGISPNIRRHFDYLVPAVKKLKLEGIPTIHFFLMADTEVDLLPFLKKIKITPENFTKYCEESVNLISQEVTRIYGLESDIKTPTAVRFLQYFGFDNWNNKYNQFFDRLMYERHNEPMGRIARGLEIDYEQRKILIEKLLGDVSSEEGIMHLARQKAQYMAFASLTRDIFGKRLVIVNHRTPNFAWMNDRITREPNDPEQLADGNYLSKLPLIELDISTLPEK